MIITPEHKQRIEQELQAVGATSYGSSKFASRYLPNVIHNDEHIKAAVYGRYKEGEGLLNFSAGMLIATDKRVIFLDHKPGFTSMDEIAYDVVSGVKKVSGGLSCSVTLHTRAGDYTIRFANAKGVDRFVDYIETRRLEVNNVPNQMPSVAPAEQPSVPVQDQAMDEKALAFLKSHEVAVLSTVDRTGTVSGAAIYYLVDDAGTIYMLTKASTQKARDIFANQQVALTVYDPDTAQTVQMHGTATVVNEPARRQEIFTALFTERSYGDEKLLPPVTTIHEEGYVVLQITPTSTRFRDYKQRAQAERP